MPSIPLAALDLIPMSSGSSPEAALRNTVDLAQAAERFGYRRYWFAEHHLNPGVLGVSPTVAIALVAGATRTIRLGSAGVQMGHRTSLSVIEEFGLIDALHPGRLDLGLGRSIGRSADHRPRSAGNGHDTEQVADNGLLLPKRFDVSRLAGSPRMVLTLSLLQQPGAYTPPYGEQIQVVLDLLRGTYRSDDGLEAHATPGEGRGVEVWILGASGGESAEVAGRHGLRFAASYHHSPSTVLDAVDSYRSAFRPSADLDRPYVSVSADVVVADDDATAAHLASGYGLWVR
ncbi:MAG: LLM class flavin-dependent oxidoreductase, partial [Acidimicrobiaceae bacterium]|nr:LLM class flavin-dependent oxidoreductase [Acidimicrobiaceae bacterium]